MPRLCIPLLFLAFFARGDGLRVLVAVNDADPASVEWGRAYASAHGVPDAQIVHLDLPLSPDLSPTQATNLVLHPLQVHVAWLHGADRIHQVALCWKQPYRVNAGASNYNALSAFVSRGRFFNAPNAFVSGCSLNASAESPYFDSERAFADLQDPAMPWLATQVAYSSVDIATNRIAQSAAARGTSPTGTVFLLRTSDLARNVQWPGFDEATRQVHLSGAPLSVQQRDANLLANESAVIGATAGRTTLLPELPSNEFLPGSIGDHLTSFGGQIHDPSGQMNALAWLDAGASATFGSIYEPCNYTEKFPRALVYAALARGFTTAEAYGQNVQSPYMSSVFGDPLNRPYAAMHAPVWIDPPALPVGGNSLSITVHVEAAAPAHPIERVHALLDGTNWVRLADFPVLAGNRTDLVIGGRSYSRTLTQGQSLADHVEALASRINADRFRVVDASARGIRLDLAHRSAGVEGTGVTLSRSHSAGTAAENRLHSRLSAPNLLPTQNKARQMIVLEGTPQAGAEVSLTITPLDAPPVVIATNLPAATGRLALADTLIARINAHPDLAGPGGCVATYKQDIPASNLTIFHLIAREAGWEGANLAVTYTSGGPGLVPNDVSGNFSSNIEAMKSRAEIAFAAGVLATQVVAHLDLTDWPDGRHELWLEAEAGSAPRPRGHRRHEFDLNRAWGQAEVIAPRPGRSQTQGSVVTVAVEAVSAGFAMEEVTLWAEGKPFHAFAGSNGVLGVETGPFGPGTLLLQARARNSGGREVHGPFHPVRLLLDRDRDGLWDNWERGHFQVLTVAAANLDSDGDGMTDGEEFEAGTLPHLSTSRVAFVESALPAMQWESVTGRWYRVESRAEPGPGAWTPDAEARLGSGGRLQAPFGDGTGAVYRLRVERR